jgi:pectate lyase
MEAQTVTITKSVGWLESAYVTWEPIEGVDSYNVYYTGEGLIDQIIDTQLIRSYGSYYRADLLGLAAGNYNVAIVPVIGNLEGTATISNNISVLAHDRNGFAHHGGRSPGAYNLDGTLKNNAVVLYITENSKNTISLDVIGATSNPCVGLQNILDGFKKGRDDRPLVVRLIGNITDFDNMLNGDIVIENKNNSNGSITFEGVGSDAVANGWGIRVKNASNIEIRNLGFMLTDAAEGDNIGLQQNNDHIWIHNCDMFYGAPGKDADQAKGDGALDTKRSTYVTISYNHFWDSGKSNLLGLNENTTTGLYVTYHHNWYDHSDSRHPRARFYSAHVYNNYFDGNSKYGAGSTLGSSLFLEGNFFRNCKYPMLTSKQGTDIYNGSNGTFSGEDGGFIKAFNNTMSGQTRFVAYDPVAYPVQFDAYVASTRDELISPSLTSFQGGNTYNNFDTDPSLYVSNLVVDSPEVARDKVMQFSGRVEGGDINWTFNNAVDDTSYDVNPGLMAVLASYSSALVFVQGENYEPPSSQILNIPSNNEQTILDGPISDMIFTWGGSATDVTVSGLPSSGINYTKDNTNKTLTVFGTPTANVEFTVTTTGPTGTSVSGSGSIFTTYVSSGDEIHNFSASGLTSSFYTFTSANMNSNNGAATYDGLTLTSRLKIETPTVISYVTVAPSTLILVLDPTFNGKIKLDNVSYTANAGLVEIPNVPAGSHAITKGDTTNLYYIKTEYALGINDHESAVEIVFYPNPVTDRLYIKSSKNRLEKTMIYDMMGVLVKQINSPITTINLAGLSSGSYIIRLQTDNGIITKKILKK